MSNTRNSILIIVAAAFGGLVVVGLLVFLFGYAFINNGELGDKEKYALLQSVELSYRDQAISDRLILKRKVKGTKFDVLGLPTENEAYPLTWVLLNDLDYQGGTIFMPSAMRLKAECEQLSAVLTTVEVRPEVRLSIATKMRCIASSEHKK